LKTSSFDLAREAAAQAVGPQHHRAGALYVVATPIGNLADISLRALHVLSLVDLIACEDTRHTGSLLRQYGLDKPLMAVHEHNESQSAVPIIEQLQSGKRVAYVSDAGTPGISDPGARLVAAARAAGAAVIPIPGASSVTTLLSVSGLSGQTPVVFAGFMPTRAAERENACQALAQQKAAVVLMEAPHRIEALARALSGLVDRRVTVGRELTKQFEEISTLPAADLPAWLLEDANRQRGEFVLVVHPATEASESGQADAQRVLTLLLAELPLKTAVRLAAEITGAPRNALYEQALALQGR
jgi:16S rRNA (cytidine1402-2'-O)-methyltransferase